MAKAKSNFRYYKWVGICILLILALQIFQSNPHWIEYGYSRLIYPIYSYIPKFLFGWIPFSIGDLVYALIVIALGLLFFKSIVFLFKKDFSKAAKQFLKIVASLLTLYIVFYASWALNYYRLPIHQQLNIKVDTILLEDHLNVLDRHIQEVNTIRENLNLNNQNRIEANHKVQDIMEKDSLFNMLSKTQVRIKKPLVGSLASYFGVSGYFNPFSHEAHVNYDMPLTSYPFTVAHELSHQMGIGFEDECNFIAFVKLKDANNLWFRYSAYYESTNYLLRTLYLVDKTKFEEYKAKLSSQVMADIKAEQDFWKQYTGWISDASGLFYDQYLKHNNQAEGMARYGMVTRLIIGWEQKNRQPN